MHILYFYCLIFENLNAGDVFVVIAPPGNDEHVEYFLMRCTHIKSRLLQPYVDGEFTYRFGDLVVMGHFFEKVRRQGDYIIYRDFMLEYIACQYSHLVVVARIHLIEIKVKSEDHVMEAQFCLCNIFLVYLCKYMYITLFVQSSKLHVTL